VGAGLAGLVATAELVAAGRSVILLEQEGEQSLGGQAWWSFGGLFFVNSPEQRRLRVKDSVELAWQDWQGTAGFDRDEDYWPRRWAEAYVHFAAGEKRAWLHQLGHRVFPVVGWAERGGYGATGPGNSVPRFHITWGTGPGVTAPFLAKVRDGVEHGLVRLACNHRMESLVSTGGTVTGVRGTLFQRTTTPRGREAERAVAGEVEYSAGAVVVTTGGIGGDHDQVRAAWPQRLGAPPRTMLSGVPPHVDGRGIKAAQSAGGRVINPDRMWHYVEGIRNWNPVWPNHGIRILPGPSSLWLDAAGKRLPGPLFPGFDTLGTLEHLRGSGHDYSWFVLNKAIIRKEFALSGSEQNPDLTGKSLRGVLSRATADVPGPVQKFLDHGEDFLTAGSVPELVAAMNDLAKSSTDGAAPVLSADGVLAELQARDREIANPFSKDAQVTAIRGARSYLGDRLIRTAVPRPILEPADGPLIAVRLSVLTRKTLGGLETDLDSRVLGADGNRVPGLFAAGEAAGFGGGGMHGYRSLEGTFLGGCLFSGRAAGRAASR
ncbi:MAG: FAD-binding dehydrogenase, partial [Arthrobacter sp.]